MFTLSRIDNDPRLQPPVGVWAVSSPSVADHPLRPANRQSLGKPLPYQQADGTRAHPQATGPEGSPSLVRTSYEKQPHSVLAHLSASCPQLEG